MSKHTPIRSALFSLLAAVAMAGTALPGTAAAWEFGRQGQYAGARGANGFYQRQGQWRPGMAWRETRWQGVRGEGWSQLNGQWDTGLGQGYRERTFQLPNGQTATAQHSAVRNPDGTVTVTGTSATGQPLRQWISTSPDGSYVGTSRNLQSGVQVETGHWITRNPQGGYTRSGGYQTSDGRTGTVSGQTSAIQNGYTRQSTIANQGGQTITRSVDVQAVDGTATRTTTVTGPAGQTRTYTGGVAIDNGG